MVTQQKPKNASVHPALGGPGNRLWQTREQSLAVHPIGILGSSVETGGRQEEQCLWETVGLPDGSHHSFAQRAF